MFEWFKKKLKKSEAEKVEEKQLDEIEQDIDTTKTLKQEEPVIKNANNFSEDNSEVKNDDSQFFKDEILPEDNEVVENVDDNGQEELPKKESLDKVADTNQLDNIDVKQEESSSQILEDEKVSSKNIGEKSEDKDDLDDTKESSFKRFLRGVNKTRKNFTYKINSVFTDNDIDDDFFEELEEIMVMGDIGAKTTMTIIDLLRDKLVEKGIHKSEDAKAELKKIMLEVMNKNIESNYLKLEPSPAIIMMVGVNGVGKTTTCGKLAYQFVKEGKSCAIIAADTFRAAAIEQLEVWGERAGVHLISQKEGADPAAVVFDGLDYSIKNNIDITIIDTAGRLHNKVNLMNELNKIRRIIDKKMPNATMEVILALDATTGQNALLQVAEFKEAANITGVSLNKLDGTAKGGVIIPIQYEEKIPVKIVGVGESIYDLQPFVPELFVDAIFD